MMAIYEILLLGVVQGVTEFLPVSSSGHLWLLLEYFNIHSLSLEVVLHAGSLVAVIAFFWKKIIQILVNMFKHNGDKLGWKLFVSTLFTVPTSLVMQKLFMADLTNQIVGSTLLVTAGLVAAAEFFRTSQVREFSWIVAMILGLVQGLAVMPGISRSGLTIVFLILIGVPRQKAAEISFLLAIPTIMGALLFSVLDNTSGAEIFFQSSTWIGFAVSALASIIAIKWMMKLIEGRWIWFAPYCAFLGTYLLF